MRAAPVVGYRDWTGALIGSLYSPNSLLYPVMVFAAAASGITISTANSSYTAHELAHQLSEASASLVLVGSDLVDVAREAAKEIGLGEDRIYVLPGVDGTVNTKGLKSYESLRGEVIAPMKITADKLMTSAACESRTVVTPDLSLTTRVSVLPFSSGTTSKPKGVQISHS